MGTIIRLEGFVYKARFKQLRYCTTAIIFIVLLQGILCVVDAQDNQVLEFTDGDGNPTVSDEGPLYTVPIRFINNTNNPAGNAFESYWPQTIATVRILNPNSLYSHTQDTDPSNIFSPVNPSLVVGWNFDDDPAIIETNGEPIDYFRLLNFLDDSDNSDYTSVAENTPGTGIDVTENRGVFIIAGFEGLRDEPVNGRYRLADLEIEFNRPVNNPVLHITGLGAFWFVDFFDENDNLIDSYENTASVELDLIDADASTFSGFNRLSGSSAFAIESGGNITDNQILNGSSIPDDIDPGVAHGSVEVQGTGITSLTFQVYARGTSDPDPCGFGWAGSSTDWYYTDGEDNCDESESVGEVYNFAQDAWMLSISTQVEPDETLLTEGDSFRMLTSPVANTSYNDLIGNLWTQGGSEANGYDTSTGDPNIFAWTPGADDSNPWQPIPNLNTGTIPTGEGFLMTVYGDDDFDGIVEGFPKTLSVTGSEPAPPILVNDGGGDSEGWLLLGNPFKDPIDINELLNNRTSNLQNVIYVWDRGIGGVDDPNREAGWRWAVTDPGVPSTNENPVLGSLGQTVLMPFQGFFIQRQANTNVAAVEFDDDGTIRESLTTTTTGTFFRKDTETPNLIVLSVQGEGLQNSLWLRFSDTGAETKLGHDALELASYNEHHITFAVKKKDASLLTFANLPVPEDNPEFPVSIETTLPGLYTVSAEDINFSLPYDLYFVDTEEQQNIRIDPSFSYSFQINQALKPSFFSEHAFLNGPKKATQTFSDRFLITTKPREFTNSLPREISLKQNYPNPFNPATQIIYELPQQSDVTLAVYDMIGRQVATLVNENVAAGIHSVNFDASDLSSGVYLYKLTTGSVTLSKKLTLIK